MNRPALHQLHWRDAVPGAERDAQGYRRAWQGTALMAVLNVTPDSFSDGGVHAGVDAAVLAGRAAWEAGAMIVDVGGESTRPGATPVEPDEERTRILPVIERLAATGEGLISVDTRHAEVARDALAAGAHVVNDVTGLRDPAMRSVCAEAGVPAVVMHMLGEPATMQDDPHYDDVVHDVEAFLLNQAEAVLRDGVPSLLLDPGWGFGKRDAHNLALLHALPRLTAHGHPVLFGASRKGSIGRFSGEEVAAKRDPGSIALHLEAARRGAAMVRVHDVAGHAQAFAVQDAVEVARTDRASGRVALQGLRFHGRHGVFEAETRDGAPFVVDVTLTFPFPKRDDVERTIDYGAVQALVRSEVEDERYDLIETLTERIGVRILEAFPRVEELLVRVHKPEAPLPGVFDDVTAERTWRR